MTLASNGKVPIRSSFPVLVPSDSFSFTETERLLTAQPEHVGRSALGSPQYMLAGLDVSGRH